ncbi:HEAT repeat domain-containing protein [Marinimicrobium sp. ARAG 43.8]|uniref:HEAT repeat domain-containing protein n=1 Tax=Marinimicrobium sp. ARAG 43.8 TaxID=3418719 RepID=UPI003CEE727D
MQSRVVGVRVFEALVLILMAFIISAEGMAITPPIDTKTVSQAEARKAVEAVRKMQALELVEGVKVDLWASDALVDDPVAISMDSDGNAWLAVTNRSNNSEFDIRGWPHWEADTLSFNLVADRREFLREYFSPSKSLTSDDIPDRNKDGVHDWRDLTVLKEEVLKVSDTDNDGLADRAQMVLEDFSDEVNDVLGGVYYDDASDSVFLTVAPNAWRARDTTGDGYLDEKTSLVEGFGVHIGFSGHNMSGVTMGPDGRIYYGIGDIGANITDLAGNRYDYAHEGVIVRSEPDGTHFEVFASGLRNTHEFTFDKYGNLISADNDGDHAGELERLVYLIDGSDTGWRIHWQFGKYSDPKNNAYKVWMDEGYYKAHFEDQSALILPPIQSFYGGPTGMVYNPGTALGPQWQDYFFLVQFTGSAGNSGINAFTLEPEGAGFTLGEDKTFLRGIQVTGLDVGPDGALYAADWVEGWKTNNTGRIWKIDAEKSTPQRDETQALLQQPFEPLAAERLITHLQHPDQRVRLKAQFELVERTELSSLEQAVRLEDQLARIHGIWGIGQLARNNRDVAEVLVPLLLDSDPEIRAQVAKVLGDAGYPRATEHLIDNLSHPNARVRMFSAQALGRIGANQSFDGIVSMLEANDGEDVYLRQAGAIALARLGDEGKLAQLATHRSVAVRVAAVIALNRLASPAIAEFLADDNDYVATNAARAINDDAFIEPGLPSLAAQLSEPHVRNEPFVRRAINANAFLSTADSAQRLVTFAANDRDSVVLRAEALNALSVWESPSVYDRVSGRYRGERSGQVDQAAAALEPHYKALLADESAWVRAAAANAVGRLGMVEAVDALAALAVNDPNADVRQSALENLHRLSYSGLTNTVFSALEDDAESVRRAALALIPSLSIPSGDKVRMYELLLEKSSLGEQQETYLALAQVQSSEAYQLLSKHLQKLIDNEIPPEVQLELVRAAESSSNKTVQETLQQYQRTKPTDDVTEQYREAFRGGDAHTGKLFFFYNTTAQCIRCHVMGEFGSAVGPDLTNIGSRLTREQLVEAMVAPGERVPRVLAA